jgi:hypothetical protein
MNKITNPMFCPFGLTSWPTARAADPESDVMDCLWDLPMGEFIEICRKAKLNRPADATHQAMEDAAIAMLELSHAWYRHAA